MARIIRSSEINVITHLLSKKELCVIVFGLPELFIDDDVHDYRVTDDLNEVKTICGFNLNRKICLINNFDKPVLFFNVDFLIEFGPNRSYQFRQKNVLNYISNKNGSMRWLYPDGMHKPWFLSFYNFIYWKASAYKMLVRFLFYFKISGLLPRGRIFIYSNGGLFYKHLIGIQGSEEKQYSIFTGTYGPNRKLLLARSDGKRIEEFYKIALNDKSQLNVDEEANTLRTLAAFSLPGVCIPRVLFSKPGVLGINNIKPSAPYTDYLFGNRQAIFLKALYDTGNQKLHFQDLPMRENIRFRLAGIRNHPQFDEIPEMKELYDKLKFLHTYLEHRNDLIAVGRNHGDFTRWNCYQDSEKIYVYDWELSKTKMPLLHDLFHFVIQVAIFSVQADFAEVDARIADALALVRVQKMIVDYGINPLLHLQLYLLENTSYYMMVYLDQPKRDPEVLLQLRTWNYLLFTHTSFHSETSHRKQFIDGLFDSLAMADYVVLKNAGKSMLELSAHSDIDLLVNRQSLKHICAWIKNRYNIQKCVVERKSFMTTVQVYFMDNSFLSIDLLTAFQRKSMQYLNAELLLRNAVSENGIKILPPAYDYLYIFVFYQINYANLPDKYTCQYDHLTGLRELEVLQNLKDYLGVEAGRVDETFAFQINKRKGIINFLKRKGENNVFRRSARFLRYLAGQFVYLIKPTGFMLTFSGVDGAGKTTIIQEVKELMENKYRRKVVVIRHRPSILPILSAWKYGKEEADKKCVESLPRMGNNNSRISSLLRFGYYYADYFFGQVVIYFKYTVRGYVVLYDRYYFDFIVDAKRSNININRSFIKGLFHFVYKPELNVFLYAMPEIILKRKKELSAEDISTLTSSYRHLFDELGNRPRYICIENIDRDETVAQIEQAFIHLN